MVANRLAMMLAGTLATIGLSVVPANASNGVVPNTANQVCDSDTVLPAQDGSTVVLPAHPRNGSTDCFLVKGDFGDGVKALQVALDDCNLHAGLVVDGDFGPLTKQAVINFQVARGLVADGGYGNNTRNAMLWPDNDSLSCTRPTHF